MPAPKVALLLPTGLRAQLFSPSDLDFLTNICELHCWEAEESPTEAEAVDILEDCVAGIGSWGTPYPSEGLMAGCPALKLWVHAAGSVKHMFGPHLQGRDFQIVSCAPAIAECVAEMVLGVLIVGLKGMLPNALANRTGPAPKPAGGRALGSSKIGILGASQVGRRVIAYLQPFGPEIWVYDPYLSPETALDLGVKLAATPQELCGRCHAISLHTPALPATFHLIGRQELQAMADDAVFVNCSRGSCVDESALIEELQKGRLFAFLDVTDPEPAAPDSPLRRLPNVVLTSHLAGGREFKIGRQVVEDVAAFLNGGSPSFVVTESMLERMA